MVVVLGGVVTACDQLVGYLAEVWGYVDYLGGEDDRATRLSEAIRVAVEGNRPGTPGQVARLARAIYEDTSP